MKHVRSGLLSLLFVATLLLSGCGAATAPTGQSVKAPGNSVGTQLDGAIPDSILQLPLTDAGGQVRHLADYAGMVLVISDGMTLCQETCPLDTATVVQTAARLESQGLGRRVQFLTITVDPARDTVPQIAAYKKLFTHAGKPSNWTVLTGSPSDVHRLWNYLGVYVKKVPSSSVKNWRTHQPLSYDIEHSDEVFFLDRRQHERFILEGVPVVRNKSDIPAVIAHYLDKSGRHNLAHPEPTAWTEGQALQVVGWLLNKRIDSHS